METATVGITVQIFNIETFFDPSRGNGIVRLFRSRKSFSAIRIVYNNPEKQENFNKNQII